MYLTIGGAEDGELLQNDLDILSMWEDRWDMEFNPSKCQVVWVTTARNFINTVYTLHGQVLEVITSAKYLGVDISSGLSWNSHTDRITGNANKTLSIIKGISRLKTKGYERLPTTRQSAPSWSTLPLFGTHTLRKKYSSWKTYNVGQLAGPPIA